MNTPAVILTLVTIACAGCASTQQAAPARADSPTGALNPRTVARGDAVRSAAADDRAAAQPDTSHAGRDAVRQPTFTYERGHARTESTVQPISPWARIGR
jgi:hypothetical protein